MSNTEALLHFLSRAGPTRAGVVRSSLNLTSATFSRLRRALGDQLLTVGRARAATYAVRRPIEGLVTPLTVFCVDDCGQTTPLLALHPVEPMGGWVEAFDVRATSGFYETDPTDLGIDPNVDLPWFLHDLKPTGFLGRGWLSRFPDLGFPGLLQQWSGDDVLRYAAQFGPNSPGALVVGQAAAAHVGASVDMLNVDDEDALEQAARQAQQASVLLSSVGGEQPKFIAETAGFGPTSQAIIKYSPPVNTVLGKRWADLLAAEHIAHDVLGNHGRHSCQSVIRDTANRRFLIIQRFDRAGLSGRHGVHTLLPLDRNGSASDQRSWSLLTQRLADEGILTRAVHDEIAWVEDFGHVIANTDMHLGNMAVRLDGTNICGMAPVYDMLPMFYAPRYSELPNTPYVRHHDVSDSALAAGVVFWTRVAASPLVSSDFQGIAATHAARP